MKKAIIMLTCLFSGIAGKAQDKALLEYNAGTNKVYFHDPETNRHLELFRDTLNVVKVKHGDTTITKRLSKYYVIKDGQRINTIFHYTPEVLRFDYVYNLPLGELNSITKQ